MKKAAFIGLGILVGFATSGQASLEENTRSISIDYVYDDGLGSEDGNGIEVGFGCSAFYELDDVAIKFAHVEGGAVERQFLGLSMEENWPIPKFAGLVPFGGFSFGYGWTDVSSTTTGIDTDKSGFVLRPELGAKWVFCDTFSFSSSIRYAFSSKNIYADGSNSDFEETNWEWAFGFRFYY